MSRSGPVHVRQSTNRSIVHPKRISSAEVRKHMCPSIRVSVPTSRRRFSALLSQPFLRRRKREASSASWFSLQHCNSTRQVYITFIPRTELQPLFTLSHASYACYACRLEIYTEFQRCSYYFTPDTLALDVTFSLSLISVESYM